MRSMGKSETVQVSVSLLEPTDFSEEVIKGEHEASKSCSLKNFLPSFAHWLAHQPAQSRADCLLQK